MKCIPILLSLVFILLLIPVSNVDAIGPDTITIDNGQTDSIPADSTGYFQFTITMNSANVQTTGGTYILTDAIIPPSTGFIETWPVEVVGGTQDKWEFVSGPTGTIVNSPTNNGPSFAFTVGANPTPNTATIRRYYRASIEASSDLTYTEVIDETTNNPSTTGLFSFSLVHDNIANCNLKRVRSSVWTELDDRDDYQLSATEGDIDVYSALPGDVYHAFYNYTGANPDTLKMIMLWETPGVGSSATGLGTMERIVNQQSPIDLTLELLAPSHYYEPNRDLEHYTNYWYGPDVPYTPPSTLIIDENEYIPFKIDSLNGDAYVKLRLRFDGDVAPVFWLYKYYPVSLNPSYLEEVFTSSVSLPAGQQRFTLSATDIRSTHGIDMTVTRIRSGIKYEMDDRDDFSIDKILSSAEVIIDGMSTQIGDIYYINYTYDDISGNQPWVVQSQEPLLGQPLYFDDTISPTTTGVDGNGPYIDYEIGWLDNDYYYEPVVPNIPIMPNPDYPSDSSLTTSRRYFYIQYKPQTIGNVDVSIELINVNRFEDNKAVTVFESEPEEETPTFLTIPNVFILSTVIILTIILSVVFRKRQKENIIEECPDGYYFDEKTKSCMEE